MSLNHRGLAQLARETPQLDRSGLGIYPPESRWQEDVTVWMLVVALIAFAFSLFLAWKGGVRN